MADAGKAPDDVHPSEVSFRELLRQLREDTGLTQVALAVRSGLSAQAISLLERGVRRRPRPSTVNTLIKAMRLTAADASALRLAWILAQLIDP